AGHAIENRRHLNASGRFRGDRRCADVERGVESLEHQVRAVEEHRVGCFAACRRSEPGDERIVPAGDRPHCDSCALALSGEPRITLWYYRPSMPDSMKDRLIRKFQDEIQTLNYELKLQLPKEIKRAR